MDPGERIEAVENDGSVINLVSFDARHVGGELDVVCPGS